MENCVIVQADPKTTKVRIFGPASLEAIKEKVGSDNLENLTMLAMKVEDAPEDFKEKVSRQVGEKFDHCFTTKDITHVIMKVNDTESGEGNASPANLYGMNVTTMELQVITAALKELLIQSDVKAKIIAVSPLSEYVECEMIQCVVIEKRWGKIMSVFGPMSLMNAKLAVLCLEHLDGRLIEEYKELDRNEWPETLIHESEGRPLECAEFFVNVLGPLPFDVDELKKS